MYDLLRTRCFLYRGGTSRGIFFHSSDIPLDFEQRKEIFLKLMGSPDIRQIDGLGGGTSHTSKVVVIAPSEEEGIDIEYEFYQIGIESSIVDKSGMCGNLLAAAGLFAVDEKLVHLNEPFTKVSIKNVNTNKRYIVHIPVKNGKSLTQGTHMISGVPRPGACIMEEFIEPEGAMTGSLLPTGKAKDHIKVRNEEYKVSIIDASHISVFMDMSAVNLTGMERLSDLNGKSELLCHLEDIRGEVSRLCGFVREVTDARIKSPALPRLVLIGPPSAYKTVYGGRVNSSEMDIRLYMLSMQRFHQSIAVTSAVCLATAAVVPGSLVNRIVKDVTNMNKMRIGHPSGIMEVGVEIAEDDQKISFVKKVTVSRTARRLMEGIGYYPAQSFTEKTEAE